MPLAAAGAVAMAPPSPILAARGSLASPSIPPWGSPMSLSPGVLQRDSGHSGSALLLADSVSPASKATGTSNFGPETGASRCLEAAPRAGVNGGSWELSGCTEWLHTGPMLQPQPGKCCPKTRGEGREGTRQERSHVGTGAAERKAIPIQTHHPILLQHSLFGGAGRAGSAPDPTLCGTPRTKAPLAAPGTDIPGHVFQFLSGKQPTK